MKIMTMAALAGLMAGPAMAQDPAPTPAPAPAPAPSADPAPGALLVAIPDAANAAPDPTCGGREALTQQAMCIQTTQGAIAELADLYNAAFTSQGWLAAGGGDNLVVYVKRRPEGGCDGFQMLAFANESRVPGPAEPAYVALAAIPGDVCATAPAATPAPAQ
jgi:hypothetical protein